MPILDAALAFALTMLVIASVVTVVVRLLQMLFRWRSGKVKKTLISFLKTELEPVVDREVNRLSNVLTADQTEAIKHAAGELKHSDASLLQPDDLKQLAELPKADAIEQVKRSELGTKLYEALGDKAQEVFAQMSLRYDAAEARITKDYRANCRVLSTWVALILAFALNIDSIFIVDTYLRDHNSRDVVLAQMDEILADYESKVQTSFGESEEEPTGEVSKEEFVQAYQETRNEIESLMGLGLPIGPAYFPHSTFQPIENRIGYRAMERTPAANKKPAEGAVVAEPEEVDPTTPESTESDGVPTSPSSRGYLELTTGYNDPRSEDNVIDWAMWVLGVLLTGVLAGIGAPFWYDTIVGISRVSQGKRKTASTTEPDASPAG